MKILGLIVGLAMAKYDYRWEIARCQNETIRAEDGREMFFVSPSFPNINNAEFDCTWRLQAPEGMRVKIRWPVFHLDSCGEGKTNSKVMVFDGKVSTHVDMVKFCGKKLPPKFVSSTRDLHISLKQFKQDHGKGVKMMVGFIATDEPSTNIRARPARPVINLKSAGPVTAAPATRAPITRKAFIPAFSNAVMEVDQGEGEFPSNYYYDYEFNLEQERRKAIEAKIAAEEEQKKTLKYKFNTLEKEDQWSLIGAACCVIVVLIIVSYMLMKRRKRLSDNDDPESPPVSRRQRSSLEKRSRSIEKH